MATRVVDRAGSLEFGGVTLWSLAAEFGTPLYVYDAESIRERLRMLRSELGSEVRVFYSVKATPVRAVLVVLRELGAGLDLCSAGDIALADYAGFPPDRTSFAGHGLTDDVYGQIADRPAMTFVADSFEQIRRMAGVWPGGAIGLRVNPEIAAGFTVDVQAGAETSRFGLSRLELPAAVALAANLSLRVVGLHSHVGSGIETAAPYLRLIDQFEGVIGQLPDLRWVNLGGGFETSTEPGGAEISFGPIRHGLRRLTDAVRGALEIRIEPGSYLTMDAGLLVARVVDIKGKTVGPSFRGTAIVDASSNQLMSATAYGVRHPVWIDSDGESRPTGTFDLAGNLMMAGDYLARKRELPSPHIGDLVAFGRCGAYTSSRSTVFNGQPRPAEVLVDGGQPRLVRRRETAADLWSRDL